MTETPLHPVASFWLDIVDKFIKLAASRRFERGRMVIDPAHLGRQQREQVSKRGEE
jgi:hypothetical protein